MSCPEYLEKGDGGFFTLCNDFVRLANTYTPSLQSPAALASLITGEYPINHGLRHPDSYLSHKYITLPQALTDRGYKTAFFSQGDPIKSYQGLSRGFQSYYDYSLFPEDFSLSEIFKDVQNYLFKSDRPEYVVVYISILKAMQNRDMAIDHLEAELNNFFDNIKTAKKWHNTNIAVVGLQGELKYSYKSTWPIIDLGEGNIKVEAFLKPATKPRDKELSFQIDSNINLADIGKTFFEWANVKQKNIKNKNQYQELTTSNTLVNYFLKNDKEEYKKGAELIESAWPEWRYGYAPIYLILDDQYRVFLNTKISIYNTLLDREITSQIDDQVPEERLYFYLRTAARLNSEGKNQFKDAEITKLSLGYQIWGLQDYKYPDILDDLEQIKSSDENSREVINWMAKLAVKHQDCKRLLSLSKESKNRKWQLAANSCLGLRSRFTGEFRTGCYRVFFKKINIWSNQCQNDLLYHAWKYIKLDRSENEARNLRSLLIQDEIKAKKTQINWQTYLSSASVNEIAIEPSDYDLYYLQLSKNQKNLIDLTKPQ